MAVELSMEGDLTWHSTVRKTSGWAEKCGCEVLMSCLCSKPPVREHLSESQLDRYSKAGFKRGRTRQHGIPLGPWVAMKGSECWTTLRRVPSQEQDALGKTVAETWMRGESTEPSSGTGSPPD